MFLGKGLGEGNQSGLSRTDNKAYFCIPSLVESLAESAALSTFLSFPYSDQRKKWSFMYLLLS